MPAYTYSQADTDHDVVDRHQKRNRRPRSPSPTYLQRVRTEDRRCQKKSKSKHSARDQDAQGSDAGTEQTEGSPALTLVAQDESRAPSRQGGKCSKKSKADQHRPTTLGFFPALWCKLLDDSKAMLRLHLVTEDPFPSRPMAIASDGICSEILLELVLKYQEDGLELEEGELSILLVLYDLDRTNHYGQGITLKMRRTWQCW